MRTFYIFKINEDYYSLTKNIPYTLYNAYLNIRLGTKNNIDLLYNEYFSFTETFNKNLVSRFLYKKMSSLDGYVLHKYTHVFNNYYTDENSKLTIYNSYMVLKSNVPNPSFFSELINIPNLFVVDFDKNDYFYLSNLSNLRAFINQ